MNISYSAYKLFRQSPLSFYFKYIEKREPGESVSSYGIAGNIVHEFIERGLIDESEFMNIWNEKFDGIPILDLKGEELVIEFYYNQAKHGSKFLTDLKKENEIETEVKFEKTILGHNLKGYVDAVDKKNHILYDWKTNKRVRRSSHELQRKIYSLLYYMKYNVIPKCKWVYFTRYPDKPYEIIEDEFTIQEIEQIKHDLYLFIRFIESNKHNIMAWEANDWRSPFNEYSSYVMEHQNKLENISLNNIGEIWRIIIEGQYCRFEKFASLPPRFLKVADKEYNYYSKNRHFMIKAVRRKNPGADISKIGKIVLFNPAHFPLEMLDDVKKLIDEYAKITNKNIVIDVTDGRNQSIRLKQIERELKKKIDLRWYQKEAMRIFSNEERGILELPTGSGKTCIAAHLIQKLKAKVLWVCDRRELIEQARNELEKYIDLEEITFVTVQTLHRRIQNKSEIFEELETFNMIVIDEYHKFAAKTYANIFNHLPNLRYKLGLTATAYRDDGEHKTIYSLVGPIIYQLNARELIDDGSLNEVKIKFLRYQSKDYIKGERDIQYIEAYNRDIVMNQERTESIVKIAKDCQRKGKKILILTQYLAHARKLKEMTEGVLITGKSSKEDRSRGFYQLYHEKSGIWIITQQIAAEGLDVPDLSVMINAAGNKGAVRTVQSIGRIMRKMKDKEAVYYDMFDIDSYFLRRTQNRIKALKSVGLKPEVVENEESE